MPPYSQAGRLLSVSSPLGADVLLLERFAGTEAISEPFDYQLSVLSLMTVDWTFDQLLAQPVTVALELPDGSHRYFNGIVAEVEEEEQVGGIAGGVALQRYTLRVVPKFWLLGLGQ